MIRLERHAVTPPAAPLLPPGARSVLAVGAHPDDIEIGCGATLHRFAASGHRVVMLVMTLGEAGGAADLRREELLASARILGVAEVAIAPFEDTKIPLTKEVITAIERVITEIDADTVLVHHGDDTHQDHRVTAESVLSASRYVRNVLYYEVPSTRSFTPDVFAEIPPAAMEVKRRALLAHASQVNKVNIADLSILDCAEANAVFRGVQGRTKRAEAFQSLRMRLEIP